MFQKVLATGIATLFIVAPAMAAPAARAVVEKAPKTETKVEKDKEKGREGKVETDVVGKERAKRERLQSVGKEEVKLGEKGTSPEVKRSSTEDATGAKVIDMKSESERAKQIRMNWDKGFKKSDASDSPAQAKERSKLFEKVKGETNKFRLGKVMAEFGDATGEAVVGLGGKKTEGMLEVTDILIDRMKAGKTSREKVETTINQLLTAPAKLKGLLFIGEKSAECLLKFRDEPIEMYLDHLIEGLRAGKDANSIFDAMVALRKARMGEEEAEAEAALCELTWRCRTFNPAAMGPVCRARGQSPSAAAM